MYIDRSSSSSSSSLVGNSPSNLISTRILWNETSVVTHTHMHTHIHTNAHTHSDTLTHNVYTCMYKPHRVHMNYLRY